MGNGDWREAGGLRAAFTQLETMMMPKKKAEPVKKPETREEHIAEAKKYEIGRMDIDNIPEPTFEFILGEECTLGEEFKVESDTVFTDLDSALFALELDE